MCAEPRTTVLDLQAFSVSTLADSEGLAVAMRAIESCLAGPDISLDLILRDLCSVPNLFEFIISGQFIVLITWSLPMSDPNQPCRVAKSWYAESWRISQLIRRLSRLHLRSSSFNNFHLSSLLSLLTSSQLTLPVKLGSIKFM